LDGEIMNSKITKKEEIVSRKDTILQSQIEQRKNNILINKLTKNLLRTTTVANWFVVFLSTLI